MSGDSKYRRPEEAASSNAGQPGSSAEQQVVHERRLHDADGVGQPGHDHHRVEQGRVVGGNDERPLVTQAVDIVDIKPAGTEDGENAQVKPEAA